jgi:hypothetical protein
VEEVPESINESISLHRATEFLAQIPKLMPRVASGLAGPNFGMKGFCVIPKAFVFTPRENVNAYPKLGLLKNKGQIAKMAPKLHIFREMSLIVLKLQKCPRPFGPWIQVSCGF